MSSGAAGLQEQQFPRSPLGLAWQEFQDGRHSSLLVFSAPQATSLPPPVPLPKTALSLPLQAGLGLGITRAPGAALTASLPAPALPPREVLVNKASVPQPRLHQQLGAQPRALLHQTPDKSIAFLQQPSPGKCLFHLHCSLFFNKQHPYFPCLLFKAPGLITAYSINELNRGKQCLASSLSLCS